MSVRDKSGTGSVAPIIKSLTLIAGLIAPGQYAQAQQTFPTASPSQVAAAIHDCLKSGDQPDKLAKMNWHREQVPPSPSGMTKYINRTNPAWMPIPNRSGGEEVCWVMAAAADGRSNYEQAISEAVGTKPKSDAKSSGWLTTSHVFVLDWFSERGTTGMRIEVHRIRR